MNKYDIFISYRHRYSTDKAEYLSTLLENCGFRCVSFDKKNLNGKYAEEILRRIDNCVDFIIVLSEQTFENVWQEDAAPYLKIAKCDIEDFESIQEELLPHPDYTRLELARALAAKKNIIPIVPAKSDSYCFEKLNLPDDIKGLIKMQCVYFNDSSSGTFQALVRERIVGSNNSSLLRSRPTRFKSGTMRRKNIFPLFGLMMIVICLFLFIGDLSSYRVCSSMQDYVDCSKSNLFFFKVAARKKGEELSSILDALKKQYLIENIIPDITTSQAKSLLSIMENLVLVEGGEYMMGADSSDANASIKEFPQHLERVSTFYISKYELSICEWYGILDEDAFAESSHDCDMPIVNVSWEDIQQYLLRLNSLCSMNFRLPTEVEWEYAARGGQATNGYVYSGSDECSVVAWTLSDSLSCPQSRPHAGVSWWKESNELGLFNMSGNVAEICQDSFMLYDSENQFWENSKVLRGGSYIMSGELFARVSARDMVPLEMRSESVGFRLALDYNIQ